MTSLPFSGNAACKSGALPVSEGGRPALAEAAGPAEQLRNLLLETVADVFGTDAELLRRPTRGRANIALARQVAMYIAHVGCRLTLTEVGELFDRDRTTVSHACTVVEIRREERDFDEAIRLLEQVIQVLEGTGRSGAEQWLSAPYGGKLPAPP